MPNLYIGDNVKCFTGRELKDYLSKLSTSWCYILEVSPWWGGFWERMVQVVKRGLPKLLSKSKIMYEELFTVICEIESVVNSRPLCYIYSSSIEEVMPSHLLGQHVLTKFNSNFNENKIDCDTLSRQVHYLQTLIDHYLNRRRGEYLFKLHERHKPTNVILDCQIKLNEFIIIEEAQV